MGSAKSRNTYSNDDIRRNGSAPLNHRGPTHGNPSAMQPDMPLGCKEKQAKLSFSDAGSDFPVLARNNSSSASLSLKASLPIPTNKVRASKCIDESRMAYAVPRLRGDVEGTSVECRSKNILNLSASQKHFHYPYGCDFLSRAPSSPMAASLPLPLHNSAGNTDGVACGSLVLRSYRRHSFASTAANSVLTLGVSELNLSNLSGSLSNMGHTPNFQCNSAAAISNCMSPTHAKYLTIAGHPLGLENYGNNCYYNSVVQLLYHCTPLRLRLLELRDIYTSKKGGLGFEENTLLFHLCSLFAAMHKFNNRPKQTKPPKPTEMVDTKQLLQYVRRLNPAFNNNMQQDAHEFAMFLLNDIMETEKQMMSDAKNRVLFTEDFKKKSLAFWRKVKDKKRGPTAMATAQSYTGEPPASLMHLGPSSSTTRNGNLTYSTASDAVVTTPQPEHVLAPLQSILQGQFCSLTACFNCGKISVNDEPFMDISLGTRQGCSLLHCLQHFGEREYFYGANKLRCSHCNELVCAVKTTHLQKLPQYALLVHLKRFCYDAKKGGYTKTSDHVALPTYMDLEECMTEPSQLSSNAGTHRKSDSRNGAEAQKGLDEGSEGSTRDFRRSTLESIRQKIQGIVKHKARFELTGFIAHRGQDSSMGHYFTCIRYNEQLWYRFDDRIVTTMNARDVQQFFGIPVNLPETVSTTAYILLYERVA